MRILTISNVPWDERNSYGNTISNWFEGWTDTVFYNVYCRSAAPTNTICDHYYTVPPLSLVKNVFRPNRTGKRIGREGESLVLDENNENDLINKAQQGNKEWMYFLTDFLYSTGIWETKAYRDFVKEADPDIVFSFAIADAFIYENYCYLKKHTKAKIVTFIADDVYGAYLDGEKIRNKLQARRFRKMIEMSDLVYGASEEMCAAYQPMFNIKMRPLYKGGTLMNLKKEQNDPLKFIYAGNLLWGRADVLEELASALEGINKDSVKATLEIYTGSFITPEIDSKLNRGESSKIYGRCDFDEIVEKQQNADIVLQVESFDPKLMKIVRYSFSTKIIDCLHAGAAMMVVGPAGIASVEYSRRVPGVILVDNLNNLTSTLYTIINEKKQLIERAESKRDFAKRYHSIETIKREIRDDFFTLLATKRNECSNHR